MPITKLVFLLPVVLSFVGFILVILGLFAGNTPGFMEDYQVMMLNTSAFGRQYVPNLDDAVTTTAGRRSIPLVPALEYDDYSDDDGQDSYNINETELASPLQRRTATLELTAVEGELAGLTAAAAADQMAALLGIGEFYSLHVMNACEGGFAPNATTFGAWRNVSNCTAPLSLGGLNVTALLDGDLTAATMLDGKQGGTRLAVFGVSADLRNALNRIPSMGMAVAIFYIVSTVAAGLSALLAVAGALSGGTLGGAVSAHNLVLIHLGLASAAVLALLITGLLLTLGVGEIVNTINRLGEGTVGLAAAKGVRLEQMTWAALGMMGATALYWLQQLHGQAKSAAAAAAAAKKEPA